MPIVISDRMTLSFMIDRRLLQRENLTLTEIEILRRAKALCLGELIVPPQLTIYLSVANIPQGRAPGDALAGFMIEPSAASSLPTLKRFRRKREPYLDALYDILLSLINTRSLSGATLRLVVDEESLANRLERPQESDGTQYVLDLLDEAGLTLQILGVKDVFVEEMIAIRRALRKEAGYGS
jgi:hypothetical protein